MKKILSFALVLVVFFSLATEVKAILLIDGKYPACSTTCTGPKPDDCYNGPSNTDSGGCGTACGVGDAWSHYTAECKNIAKMRSVANR